MESFMTAKEANTISEKNRDKKIESYYSELGKDRLVKKIERTIAKAVTRGDKDCHVSTFIKPSEERNEAIITYFDNLGYDINNYNGVYHIGFYDV